MLRAVKGVNLGQVYERLTSNAVPPFPIYDDLVSILLDAHSRSDSQRDPVVAHVLGTCAGYAYGDTQTVATIMARLGLMDNACVRVALVVDAMFIFSTAYLVQSRCGRVVILCYRGTEPANLGNWLADADTEPAQMKLDAESARVHSGFYRNIRGTRLTVIEQLRHALEGRSLLAPKRKALCPLEALYVTGHSLGGAMSLLFALAITGAARQSEIAQRLRAVYTFGQPMALVEPLPEVARSLACRIFRHVTARDIVPALPAGPWGAYEHFGNEYVHLKGEWRQAAAPTRRLASLREIPRSLMAMFSTEKRRNSSRYTLTEHGPHQYIAALRPAGKVTEFGDMD